jgi:hypothetical protein
MVARIADDLSRCVKAHWLRIQERVAQLLDETQLVGEDRYHFTGHALGIARGGAFPSEFFERLPRRQAGHGRLFWILICKLVERETAARGNVSRAADRRGILSAECPVRLLGLRTHGLIRPAALHK